MLNNKKEVISFRKTVAGGTSMVLKERIKDPGTVEGLRVRFYPGQEKALQVFPFVEHKGQRIESLITYAEETDRFLSGDDDYMEYAVVVPVDYDDYIKIDVKNASPYDYDVAVDVFVDYFGGQNRVIGGVY